MLSHGFNPARFVRRASGLYVPPAGNVITNWAGLGTGGTGGLPDGWTATTVAGVTFSVLGRTPFRGGNIIEIQFAGTASAGGNAAIQLGSPLSGVASPGQVWRQRVFLEAVGTPSPGLMTFQGQWRTSAPAFLGLMAGVTASGTIPGAEIAPSDSTAPANTVYCGLFLLRTLTSGQTVNLRYRVFAPTLYRVS